MSEPKQIRVHLKLYSGLEKEIRLEGYDPYQGMTLTLPKGARLKTLAERLDLKSHPDAAVFVNGKRVMMWRKLNEGDQVACLKPSAGG